MNLNKLSALALMALLTACASTQEKEAQTAKAEQAEKALDELNSQVRSQSEMLSTSAKQTAQSQKAIEELNKQLKDQSDVLTTTLSKATVLPMTMVRTEQLPVKMDISVLTQTAGSPSLLPVEAQARTILKTNWKANVMPRPALTTAFKPVTNAVTGLMPRPSL